MSDWKYKRDFDINKSVAVLEGYQLSDEFNDNFGHIKIEGKESEKVRDYCNNPSYAHDIILRNRISIAPYSFGDWMACQSLVNPNEDCNTLVKYSVDMNPLRAAMIVYLEMSE